MKHVFIIGSRGLPAKYGGFETFVEKLTEYQKDSNIQYYVACMRENSAKSGITEDQFEHNGAICFNIDVQGSRLFYSQATKAWSGPRNCL